MKQWQNFQAFSKVKASIEQQVRDAAATLENSLDRDQVVALSADECSQYAACLSRIAGVLRMMECQELALLAEEILGLLEDAADAGQGKDQHRIIEMRELAFVALTDFPALLEGVLSGHIQRWSGISQLFNRIRQARGRGLVFSSQTLLTRQSVAFRKVFAENPEHLKTVLDQQLKLYNQIKKQLHDNSDVTESVKELGNLFSNLEVITRDFRLATLWGLCAAIAEALPERQARLEHPSIKLLCSFSTIIQMVRDKGMKALSQNVPDEILAKVLAVLAGLEIETERLSSIRCWFSLDPELVDARQKCHQELLISYTRKDAFTKVIKLMTERADHLLDQINEAISEGSNTPQQIAIFATQLGAMRGPLAALGMQPLVDLLSKCVDPSPVDTDIDAGLDETASADYLDRCAQALYRCELSLQRHAEELERAVFISRAGKVESNALTGAKLSVVLEAIKNLDQVVVAINNYAEADWDSSKMLDTAGLLRSAGFALATVPLARAADFCAVAAKFVETRLTSGLLTSQDPAFESATHAFAHVVISAILYLEQLSIGRTENCLRIERECSIYLQTLRFGDSPAVFADEHEVHGAEAGVNGIIIVSTAPGPVTEPFTGNIGNVAVSDNAETAANDPVELKTDTNHLDKAATVNQPNIPTDEDEEIHGIFVDEASELLVQINECHTALAEHPGDSEALTTLRRSYHTLKGSGRMVGAAAIGALAWRVENLLNNVISGRVQLAAPMLHTLLQIRAKLLVLVADFEARLPSSLDADTVAGDIARVDAFLPDEKPAVSTQLPTPAAVALNEQKAEPASGTAAHVANEQTTATVMEAPRETMLATADAYESHNVEAQDVSAVDNSVPATITPVTELASASEVALEVEQHVEQAVEQKILSETVQQPALEVETTEPPQPAAATSIAYEAGTRETSASEFAVIETASEQTAAESVPQAVLEVEQLAQENIVELAGVGLVNESHHVEAPALVAADHDSHDAETHEVSTQLAQPEVPTLQAEHSVVQSIGPHVIEELVADYEQYSVAALTDNAESATEITSIDVVAEHTEANDDFEREFADATILVPELSGPNAFDGGSASEDIARTASPVLDEITTDFVYAQAAGVDAFGETLQLVVEAVSADNLAAELEAGIDAAIATAGANQALPQEPQDLEQAASPSVFEQEVAVVEQPEELHSLNDHLELADQTTQIEFDALAETQQDTQVSIDEPPELLVVVQELCSIATVFDAYAIASGIDSLLAQEIAISSALSSAEFADETANDQVGNSDPITPTENVEDVVVANADTFDSSVAATYDVEVAAQQENILAPLEQLELPEHDAYVSAENNEGMVLAGAATQDERKGETQDKPLLLLTHNPVGFATGQDAILDIPQQLEEQAEQTFETQVAPENLVELEDLVEVALSEEPVPAETAGASPAIGEEHNLQNIAVVEVADETAEDTLPEATQEAEREVAQDSPPELLRSLEPETSTDAVVESAEASVIAIRDTNDWYVGETSPALAAHETVALETGLPVEVVVEQQVTQEIASADVKQDIAEQIAEPEVEDTILQVAHEPRLERIDHAESVSEDSDNDVTIVAETSSVTEDRTSDTSNQLTTMQETAYLATVFNMNSIAQGIDVLLSYPTPAVLPQTAALAVDDSIEENVAAFAPFDDSCEPQPIAIVEEYLHEAMIADEPSRLDAELEQIPSDELPAQENFTREPERAAALVADGASDSADAPVFGSEPSDNDEPQPAPAAKGHIYSTETSVYALEAGRQDIIEVATYTNELTQPVIEGVQEAAPVIEGQFSTEVVQAMPEELPVKDAKAEKVNEAADVAHSNLVEQESEEQAGQQNSVELHEPAELEQCAYKSGAASVDVQVDSTDRHEDIASSAVEAQITVSEIALGSSVEITHESATTELIADAHIVAAEIEIPLLTEVMDYRDSGSLDALPQESPAITVSTAEAEHEPAIEAAQPADQIEMRIEQTEHQVEYEAAAQVAEESLLDVLDQSAPATNAVNVANSNIVEGYAGAASIANNALETTGIEPEKVRTTDSLVEILEGEFRRRIGVIRQYLDGSVTTDADGLPVSSTSYLIPVHTLYGNCKVAEFQQFGAVVGRLERLLQDHPYRQVCPVLQALLAGFCDLTEKLIQNPGTDSRFTPSAELQHKLDAFVVALDQVRQEMSAPRIVELGGENDIAFSSAENNGDMVAPMNKTHADEVDDQAALVLQGFLQEARTINALIQNLRAELNEDNNYATVTASRLRDQCTLLEGAASVAEQGAIVPLCRELASAYQQYADGLYPVTPAMTELFNKCHRYISDCISSLETGVFVETAAEDLQSELKFSIQELVSSRNATKIQIAEEQVEDSLLAVFIEEASEILQELDSKVADWQQAPDDRNIFDDLLRSLHTLKGSAALVGEKEMSEAAHQFESCVIDSGRTSVTRDKQFFVEVDRHLNILQVLFALYHVDEAGRLVKVPMNKVELAQLMRVDAQPGADEAAVARPALGNATETQHGEIILPQTAAKTSTDIAAGSTDYKVGTTGKGVNPAAGAEPAATVDEHVRVSANLLKSLLNDADEISISRNRIEQTIADMQILMADMEETLGRIESSMNTFEFYAKTRTGIRQGEKDGAKPHEDASNTAGKDFDALEMDKYTELQQVVLSLLEDYNDVRDLKTNVAGKIKSMGAILDDQQRSTNKLQEGLVSSQMVPFAGIAPRLRRLVRQVSTELDKQVTISFDNPEGKVDRSVLQALINPIEHMIRNALDHGIESQEDRMAAGKPAQGELQVKLYRQGANILLDITDDGRGINTAKVRRKAIAQGLLAEGDKISEQELCQFILRAGFSTSDTVSHISGRGVGLDVVQDEISQIGGDIEIVSRPGSGTTFRIRLPMASSLNRALLFSVGGAEYVMLLNTIDGIILEKNDTLQRCYGEEIPTFFNYGDKSYELAYLGSLLDEQAVPEFQGGSSASSSLVLVSGNGKNLALHVDSVVGSRELLVKSLGAQFSSISILTGGVILGDGRVVVVLDPRFLVENHGARKTIPVISGRTRDSEKAAVEFETGKTIMVVDDSITVRKVTSAILKRAGMNVILAKNGIEAVELLQTTKPDVMLLDIEMPKMDGFEVAAYVRRQENGIRNLPIIMITSRIGDKHRTRAEEIGVNQYMCKPFQEVNLLEAIAGYN